MERDFLRIGEENSGAVVKKSPSGPIDAAFSADSNVQWPFANKVSATQKFISFETAQVDKHKKLSFNPLSSTGSQHIPSDDAFKTTQKAYFSQASQRSLGHGARPFALNAYRNQSMSTNISLQEPFGSVITKKTSSANLTPRANAQLTIFYAGSVMVYDNITFDAAQAIFLMASKESNTAVKAVYPRSGASVLPLFKGLVSNGQNLTQTLNNTNHVAYSCSGHSTTVSRGANSVGAMISPSHNVPSKIIKSSMGVDTAATSVPRALPQARKASLARFLEKRKERLSNPVPYSCEKNRSKNSISLKGAAPSSKCSSTDIFISNNRMSSWLVSQTKSCNDNDDCLSTKLQM